MNLRTPVDADCKLLNYDKFGIRRPISIDPSQKPHSGVDLRPHQNGGTKNVYACEAGRVINNTPNAGSYIAIEHENGWVTIYVHLTQRLLPIGAKVVKGQKIGVYSDHLHLTVRVAGVDRNPEDFINFEPNKNNMFDLAYKGLTSATQSLNLPSEEKGRLQALLDVRDLNLVTGYYSTYTKELEFNVTKKVTNEKQIEIDLLKTALEEAKKVTDVRIIESQAAEDSTVKPTTQKWDWIANEKWGVYTGSALAFISQVFGLIIETNPEIATALDGQAIANGGSSAGLALIILRSIYQIVKKNKENATK